MAEKSNETPDGKLTESYNGWAPCVHNDEDKAALPDVYREITPSAAAMELLWISFMGSLTIDGDQWFAVIVKGQIMGKKDPVSGDRERTPFETYVQCDGIEEGLIASLLVWRRKHEEVDGDEYW